MRGRGFIKIIFVEMSGIYFRFNLLKLCFVKKIGYKVSVLFFEDY